MLILSCFFVIKCLKTGQKERGQPLEAAPLIMNRCNKLMSYLTTNLRPFLI